MKVKKQELPAAYVDATSMTSVKAVSAVGAREPAVIPCVRARPGTSHLGSVHLSRVHLSHVRPSLRAGKLLWSLSLKLGTKAAWLYLCASLTALSLPPSRQAYELSIHQGFLVKV